MANIYLQGDNSWDIYLSTDVMPVVNVPNKRVALVVDTATWYVFHLATATWYAQ